MLEAIDMWFYLVTFIAVGFVPLILAAYGVQLAALALDGAVRRNRIRQIWSVAIFGLVFFAVSEGMSYRADRLRDEEDQAFKAETKQALEQISSETNPVKRMEEIAALGATLRLPLPAPPSALAPLRSSSPLPQNAPDEDELLVNAQKELRNCSNFLMHSDYRKSRGYGASSGIEEETRKLKEFNTLEEHEPSPNEPPGHAESVRNGYQAQITKLEKVFSDGEMRVWNRTYGPEFEPVYRQMMDAVSNFHDFDDSVPMRDPENLGMVRKECQNLGSLIEQYHSQHASAK